jgi:hydroxymethylglutaryl-CoA synthase
MAVNNRVKITNDIELKDRLVAINRVTKVTKGGRTFSFSAIVVVGNEDGIIGWGLGKAGEVTAAIAKGVEAAKKNLTRVPVLKGTVPHEQSAKFGGAEVFIKPASTGTGVVAGGGAVAVLVSANPTLLEIENKFGVATESVFDFFKPRRETTKDLVQNLPETFAEKVEIFTDEPVFDGQYSNQCYQDRIREAYQHYKEESGREKPYENWRFLIFHLPYAFHGKRLFTEIFGLENGMNATTSEDIKAIAQTDEYKNLVAEKIEITQRASSEIGNMYTASIFMALLSAFQVSYENGEDLAGKELGFLAYGSGSKSKVFAGKIGSEWKSVVEKWNIFEVLNQRRAIDFDTYENLHRKKLSTSVNPDWKGFGLVKVEKESPVLVGARYYERR